MRLQMQAIHFDADPKLLSFIQQKLDKLDTFYDRITSGEVFLKLDKSDNAKLQTKLLEVKLYVPGGTMFVREQGTTFEEATDLAIDTLKMQVKKFKDKRNNARAPKIIEGVALEDGVTLITEETEE
ncbi:MULTISPECIES: ribosome hibernation-promoting factor, HPF/YfiA family [Dyadobacter]|jgi:putative sigma-54 modulation protein|uniref:Ribosome-associated translation inhibitor RaiA n=1 Tax=Dyadobacter chenhuakuii TaxID=2909339 RepID=A0A9X1TU85_9BACT|nr:MULTISPECIES: ribosome-associated translation inhibitor RaiA [Dyadobacter]MCE7071855.1 ribosome-associated translation inhibitor RaiA [Dyadobacter sp. CY327]MCF2486530.1 ribosome-associated translation inhibitor RaiA [Dyadobacter sp. CY347]MCF2496315.1 ribosome-associated translation inhibitor RaiA [Dyadobacter chenhuakuii]MCF2501054.1 ribosome-associated translation inhibitor RaiA [Dyadobacter chenhuakuii]MCF2519520.1 ribosome-associated translation inhibitor RaiA [Dyadobacter sp. CY351]